MQPFFNYSGPINPSDHYYIDPLSRFNWKDVFQLISTGHHVLFESPRKTGKTSALLAMVNALKDTGGYSPLYVSVGAAQATSQDIDDATKTICKMITMQVTANGSGSLPSGLLTNLIDTTKPRHLLTSLLSQWATRNEKPCVLFVDDIDALSTRSLRSLIDQIQEGLSQHIKRFPLSIVLCGTLGSTTSSFKAIRHEVYSNGNICGLKVTPVNIGWFNQADIAQLFKLHTKYTGQPFEQDIFAELWRDTKGQPWLVNRLGYLMTHKQAVRNEQKQPITLSDYRLAREQLIQARESHHNQLDAKLLEPPVKTVLSSVFAGLDMNTCTFDEIEYVKRLGLIETAPQIQLSNALYTEIILRELTFPAQVIIDRDVSLYLTTNNTLDIQKLLDDFSQFYHENAEQWCDLFEYRESYSLWLLQAFLQRVIDGHGRIHRHFVGQYNLEILIEWPQLPQNFEESVQYVVLNVKWRNVDIVDSIPSVAKVSGASEVGRWFFAKALCED